MTEPISQHGVESEIMRLSGLAEKVTHELAKRARAAAVSEAEYRSAFARAFLSSDGAMELRTQNARLECEELNMARMLAAATLEAAKEAGRNYRTQLESLRSINANLRPLVTS